MKYATAMILTWVGLVGCGSPTQGKIETGRDIEVVLASYRRRVHRLFLPHQAPNQEADVGRLLLGASTIAQQQLIPERQLLMARALRELAELPDQADRDPTSQWSVERTIDRSTISQMVNGFTQEWEPEEGEKPNRDAFLYAFSFWSPKAAALAVRDRVLMEVLSVNDYSHRAMLKSLAPPVLWAVNRDPKRPVIAVDMGPEVCIVHLERTEQGVYVDTKTVLTRQTWEQGATDGKPEESR